MKLFHAKIKVNTCTICEIGLFTEEEEEDVGFGNFTYAGRTQGGSRGPFQSS